MKVLISDDQPIVLEVLEHFLKRVFEDPVIIKHTSVKAASTDLETNHRDADLVISDLDFDGDKRFKLVQTAGELKRPCMVYSAHYNRTFVDTAFRMGAIAFISKLGDVDELMKALSNYSNLKGYVSPTVEKQLEVLESEDISRPELDAQEVRILQRTIRGMSASEIASELKLARSSVYTYINKMTSKNNCTKAELVRRYIMWNAVR